MDAEVIQFNPSCYLYLRINKSENNNKPKHIQRHVTQNHISEEFNDEN